MNRLIQLLAVIGAIYAAIFIGITLMTKFSSPAHGMNYEPVVCDNEPDPEECTKIHTWYERVVQPGQEYNISCCGVGDAYWAEIIEVRGSFVRIKIVDGRVIQNRIPRNGQEFDVPYGRMDDKHQGNPTGHNIVFIGQSGMVYCFFQGIGT